MANTRESNSLMVSKSPRARASSITRQKKGIFKTDLLSLGRAHNLWELLVLTRCRDNKQRDEPVRENTQLVVHNLASRFRELSLECRLKS